MAFQSCASTDNDTGSRVTAIQVRRPDWAYFLSNAVRVSGTKPLTFLRASAAGCRQACQPV